MTLYLSHDISYGCTVINDSFIENALPRNFIKTTIHVIQPRAPNSRNTSLLSMQFSNGYDSDTGENRWTSVLNISFENWHLSLYKSWSTHSSYFNTDELRVHMDWWRIVFILRSGIIFVWDVCWFNGFEFQTNYLLGWNSTCCIIVLAPFLWFFSRYGWQSFF